MPSNNKVSPEATMEAPPPLDINYIPSVHITELPADAPISEILSVLDLEGGLILKDLVSPEDLAAIESEISAYTSDKKSVEEAHDGFKDFIPNQTILVGGLVGKSATAAKFCEHPVLEELRKHILTESGTSRLEDYDHPHHIDPLLSISLSFRIGYGAPRQKLHRDDVIHLIDHNKPFELKKASQFACLVAGVETTRENGATMFVPGSHRWDDKREPKLDEVTFAEMKPGSALIFLASAWHGGGHNSVPGVTRVVHGFFFCRGIYRTEENQFLAIPRSKALMMTPKMLDLLGYKKPLAALGLVENGDPMKDIYGSLQAASS